MAIRHLRSKLVLVTGAASGIGLEVALAFAREGARLIVTDINVDALSKAQRAVKDLGAPCHTYVAWSWSDRMPRSSTTCVISRTLLNRVLIADFRRMDNLMRTARGVRVGVGD